MTRMNCILSLLLCTLMATGCEKPEPAPDPEPIVNPDPETPADPRDIPNDDGVLRVLAIGNSFSADAVEQELWPLFHAKGKKVIIGELYISGCDLQTHWERTSTGANAYSYRKISDESSGAMVTKADAKFEDGLQDERWDYISLQQGGGHHGQWETFEPWLSKMIGYLREHAPYRKFKLVYHVPWVAPATSSSYKFGYYDYNTAKMYSMITETTKKVEEAIKPDLIINTVDAIQNGRSSYLGDTFDRDGWHLNKTYGRYTAGCIWYEKLSGENVPGNPYHPDTISDYVAEICQTAAHEACLHPYQVTDLSGRFTDPDPKTDVGTVLAEWEFNNINAVEDAYIGTFTGLPDNSSSLGQYKYNNNAGEVGYIASNKVAGGRLSYVQTDKSAWSTESGNERAGTMISAAGLPNIAAALPGDYLLLETVGKEFKAGTRLHAELVWETNKYGSKYWLLEYQDGGEWKPVPGLDIKTETISGTTYDSKVTYSETITYNISFGASEARTIETDITLGSDTNGFRVRMTCCMEYQVNGRHFQHPRTQSVQTLKNSTKLSILD